VAQEGEFAWGHLTGIQRKVNAGSHCSLWLPLLLIFPCQGGLKSGINGEEAAALLTGSLEMCPPEEAIALLYAQHWAESNANPDTEATDRLERAYGVETTKAVNVVLRMVRVDNLAGNLWDYFLYKLSRGKWGN
jgi:hypothetical protein